MAVIVGEFVQVCAAAPAAALARPKSSTFTVPSRRDLDVGRLQIAVDDPLVVRGLERLRDLPGDFQRVLQPTGGPPAIRSASVWPSTEFETNAGRPSASSRP